MSPSPTRGCYVRPRQCCLRWGQLAARTAVRTAKLLDSASASASKICSGSRARQNNSVYVCSACIVDHGTARVLWTGPLMCTWPSDLFDGWARKRAADAALAESLKPLAYFLKSMSLLSRASTVVHGPNSSMFDRTSNFTDNYNKPQTDTCALSNSASLARENGDNILV